MNGPLGEKSASEAQTVTVNGLLHGEDRDCGAVSISALLSLHYRSSPPRQ